MSTAPKWSPEKDWLTSDRWYWRREVETVSWWPATPHTTRDLESNTPVSAPRADWTCTCSQINWPWRTHCYQCGHPRPNAADSSGNVHAVKATAPTKAKHANGRDQVLLTSDPAAKSKSSASDAVLLPGPAYTPADKTVKNSEPQG